MEILVENCRFEPLFSAALGRDRDGISLRSLTSETKGPWAILWRCLHDPAFSRFGTVPASDGRMGTRRQHILR